MAFWDKLKSRLGRKQNLSRGYRDVVAVGGQNSDWLLQSISDDADLWQNAYALTARVDDLFKTNPLYIKYRELIWANVFGSDGIMLRMKIQETEDRVVYAKDEKIALVAHEARINRIRDWAASRTSELRSPNSDLRSNAYRAFKLADSLEDRSLESVLRGQALIQVGSPDLYANKLIESGFKDWQRKEYCDLRGTRNYLQTCQLRLIGAIRHGDFFIRLVRDPSGALNKYGFSLQLIAAQWVDRFYNEVLPNGNVVIMGIEYQSTPWGLGKAVGYHFIKRIPNDWQISQAGMFGFGSSNQSIRQRVDASEIIHYARPVDAESTRPAPWVASTIPAGRQLDQAMIAEVIAWRESACKTGWLWSDVNPEGGMAGQVPDPKAGLVTNALAPGETGALPWGVKYQERNPTHPNANVEQFRKASVRAISAGMPAADYNTLANDLENINFSAGRLGRLDTNEMSKLIQRFDIDTAERPIFEAWLEMALITGAVPLPLVKLAKFNKPVFQGRRWAQVDEIKAVNAAALRVANKFSSRNRECADEGIDFEENVMELAEEEMILEQLGLDSATTVEGQKPAKLVDDQTDGGTDVAPQDGSTTKPAAKKSRTVGEAVSFPSEDVFGSFADILATLPADQHVTRAFDLLGDNKATFEKAIEEADDMKIELFLNKLAATMQQSRAQVAPVAPSHEVRATQPIHIAFPPIENKVEVDMSKFKLPEQKAPIVNIEAARAADVNIMVPKQLPPVIQVNPTPVTVENTVNVPTATKMKIKRNSEGQMTMAEIERE